MASHITDDHVGSSIPITTATNALRNRLNIISQKKNSYRLGSMPIEAELCLLICSMFPDNFRIPVDDLVIYGMGLNLFEDVHGMFATRDRVIGLFSIINDLKYPIKVTGEKIRLAYQKDGQYVKMLVGARDLAKLIALSYPLVFHRETVTGKWPGSSSYEDCYGLSLELKKINEYPFKLECPKIDLLQLHYKEDSKSIPIDFFEGMKDLRVLSLDVPSLPQSISVLRNLTTLRLKVAKFEDMFWIGGLINLEFLSITTMNMTDIPREMGQLENLRLLDLRKMNISYIPPGVFSRLLKLEELYFPLSFRRWGCKPKRYDDHDEWESGEEDNYDDEERINSNISEIDDGERINASLGEIVSLSLNALQITVPKASTLPKKSPVFKNVQQFKILMPNNVKYQPFGKDSINELRLTCEACDIKESGICDLMSRTEDLSLIRVRNLKNVIFQLQDDFMRLKRMIISECDELEYVVDTMNDINVSEGDYFFRKLECLHLSMLSNLKEICKERWKSYRWLPNLTFISIRFCHKLKYVFPLSIVRGSILKSVEILDCNEIEGIFCEDEEDDIPLTLGSIEKLDLHSLPRLCSLLVQKDNTMNEVHDDTNESLTTNKIVSNYTEGSISTSDDEDFICTPSTPTSRAQLQESVIQHVIFGKPVSFSQNQDENKGAIGHMKMYSALSSKFAEKWLKNLTSLKIAFCDRVKVVFLFEEHSVPSKAFNSLKELELHGLQNLVHIWFRIPPNITAFQNLQLLVLFECNSLYVFSSRVAKLMVQLQKIYISRCEKMEEIIVEEDEDEVNGKIVFPQLKLLELQHIPNLRVFFGGFSTIEFPLLESLKLNECYKMKPFSYGSWWTPMLKRIEINGSLQSLMGDAYLPGQSFSFAALKIATQNFRADNLLGEGSYGKVYKGWIDKKIFAVAPFKTSTGIAVAVKRLNSEAQQGYMEGKSEFKFLKRMLHLNVVQLLGYCQEDGELLLVYEFMQRGSLDNHLFTNSGNSLSWNRRIKIAIGAARGLDFLHTEKKVIHRDIKTSVILLDDNYDAKVSGFGLARLGPSDGDPHVTVWPIMGLFGNYGYAAPEYFTTGHLYVKSDVYSFGVVLLELITGLRVLDRNRPRAEQDLVEWLKPILSQKRELRNTDVRIQGQYSLEALLLAVRLTVKCLQTDPETRPSMKEVVYALEQIQAIEEKRVGRLREDR